MLNGIVNKRTVKKVLSLFVLIYFVFLQTAYPALAVYDQVTGPTSILNGTDFYKMDMARDSSGNLSLVAVNPGSGSPMLNYYSYNGSSWSGPSQVYTLPQGVDYYDVKLAIDPVTDYPWIVWWSHSNDMNTSSFKYTYHNGSSWQGPFVVNADPPFSEAPIDISFYSNGDPLIVSGKESDGGFDFYSWGGSSFNSPVHVGKNFGTITQLKLEIYGSESSGDVHIFGMPAIPVSNTSDIKYLHASLSSGSYTWDDNVVDILNFINTGGWCFDTHITPAGVVSLATEYSFDGTDYVYYRNRTQPGVWSDARTVASGTLTPGNAISLYELTDGVSYVVYAKNEVQDLVMHYSTNGGSVWSSEVVLNSNDLYLLNNKLALVEASGELIVTEYGNTEGPPDFRYYSITASGGGGEGVPEFSTYMFILTITAGFGAIYYSNNKNQGVVGA